MVSNISEFTTRLTTGRFGVFGALVTRQSLRIKFTDLAKTLRWVDAGDTFATHCLGGVVATVMTGLFAQKEVASYDGFSDIAGGVFYDGNYRQLAVQVLEAAIGLSWSFIVSFLIIWLIDCVPHFEVLAKDK